MIYLFAGEDSKTKLGASEKFLKSLSPNQEVLFVGKNGFDHMEFESLYSSSGLFFDKCTVVLTDILENETAREFILPRLELIAGSVNDFVFVEGKLDKGALEAFKEARTELNIYELLKGKGEKRDKFNSFMLADALAKRDKLNLWAGFREAMDRGVAMEEIAGVLFWKAKDMTIKRSFGKFSEGEIKNFAAKIAYILPQARKKGRDDEAAFEKFLLEAL